MKHACPVFSSGNDQIDFIRRASQWHFNSSIDCLTFAFGPGVAVSSLLFPLHVACQILFSVQTFPYPSQAASFSSCLTVCMFTAHLQRFTVIMEYTKL